MRLRAIRDLIREVRDLTRKVRGRNSRDLSGVAPPRAKPSENVTLPIEPDRPTTDCFRPKAISRREENGATKYTELNDEIDEIGF